jgi:ligand-binding sensor domain-containing protein
MKTNKLIGLTVLAYLFAFLPINSRAEELPFLHMTTEGTIPLPSGSVQDILQDRLGFVWLALFTTGISRYDGHSLETYSIADGLLDVTVRALVEDRSGHLWVGSESGLAVSTKPLDAYAPTERIRFTSTFGNDVIVPRRTGRNCVVADLDGWVWQGTGGDGLYRFRLKDGKLETRSISTDIFDSGKNIPVTSIVVRRDGTVWVALKEGLWISFNRKGQQSLLDPQQLGAERKATSAMAEGPSGSFWIGLADGSVYRFDPKGSVVFEDFGSPINDRVVSIHESSTGELWVASVGNGLARFSVKNDRKPDLFHPQDGLLSDTFWKIMKDREGAIWFAQNGGLSRLAPDYQAIGRYTKRTLPDPSVFAVLPPYRRDENKALRASSPVFCPHDDARKKRSSSSSCGCFELKSRG